MRAHMRTFPKIRNHPQRGSVLPFRKPLITQWSRPREGRLLLRGIVGEILLQLLLTPGEAAHVVLFADDNQDIGVSNGAMRIGIDTNFIVKCIAYGDDGHTVLLS